MSATATPWRRVVILVLGFAAAVSTVVLAFLWPSVTSEPRNIPIAITGPAEQVALVTTAIEENAEGRLLLDEVEDRSAAVDAIESRESLGAVVLGAQPEVLVASAASPAVAQLLTALAAQLEATANAQAQAQAAAAGVEAPVITVAVTDVVPLAESDERGTGIAASAFPLAVAGFLGGLLIALLVRGASRRLAALLGFSLVTGLALTAILQSWLGILQESFGLNYLAVSLLVLAVTGTIVGLHSTLGRPGLPLAIVTIMLIANPISAAAVPWQFLPEPWGLIGQWFPPGAGATLLRDLSYFPEAASLGFAWSVLAVWALGGLTLVGLGLTERRTAAQPAAA